MLKNFLIIICLGFFFGCSSQKKLKINPYQKYVSDSIYLEYNSNNGVILPILTKDDVLFVNNRFTNSISLFRKYNNNIYVVDSIIDFAKNRISPRSDNVVFQNDGLFFQDKKNDFYHLKNDSLYQLPTKISSEYYYGNWLLEVSNLLGRQLFWHKDTIYLPISFQYYLKMDSLRLYSANKLLQKIVVSDSMVHFYQPILDRPKKTYENNDLYPMICYNSLEKKAIILYPKFNELIVYDLQTNHHNIVKLSNKLFVKNVKFDSTFSDLSRDFFLLNTATSFEYVAIRYNPKTNHYLLVFNTPQIDFKTWLQSPPIGVILDSKFKILDYIELENDYTVSKGTNFSNFPDGVLMRINHTDIDKENYEKFYILNF